MTDEQKKELLKLHFAMADALCADLENGVDWLNDRAHKDFRDNHPYFNVAWQRFSEKLEELCSTK